MIKPLAFGLLYVAAFLALPSRAEAQLQQFRNGSVVLTGPQLSPSWGDWAFFPYALPSPGASLSGVIRTFPGRSLAMEPGALRRDVARQMLNDVPELALISVAEPGKMSSAFKIPDVGMPKMESAHLIQNTTTIKSDSVYFPIRRRDTQWLLAAGRPTVFRLERISPEEFSLTLEPEGGGINGPQTASEAARLRLLPPEAISFDKWRLDEVIRDLAGRCEISIHVPEDLLQAQLEVVTFEGNCSPFVALERIVREHAAQLTFQDGVWRIKPRAVVTRIFCPRGDSYWGIIVSRGGDVEVTVD